MRERIRKVIYNFNFPKFMYVNAVLLESNPDFADNVGAVYNRMIEESLNEKVKMIWVNKKDYKDKPKTKNVFYYNLRKNFIDSLKMKYFKVFAKCILDCNEYVYKENKNQFRIYLSHGMPIKMPIRYCREIGQVDYIVSTSDYFNDGYKNAFNVTDEQIAVVGYPRNDKIFESKKVLYPEIKRDKTIIWMPTFRNHKTSMVAEAQTGIAFKYGVPCLDDEAQVNELDDFLAKENILLVIKLHPAENTLKFKALNCSNIKIFESADLNKNEDIYDYLGGFDALITDYSSIYYDFLLTGKTIGLAVPDLKEYSEHMTMFHKDYMSEIAGDKILSFDDLKQFISNVGAGNDICKAERENAAKKFHKFRDNKSTDRVLELIKQNTDICIAK